MIILAPEWVAPVVTVVVFVTTTAAGFVLMRVGFNIRPRWEPRRERERSRVPRGAGGEADKTPSRGTGK